MQLEDVMLSEVNQVQKDKGCMFSHMCKIDPKDKHIHKNKHDHVQTYVEHVCNRRTALWNLEEIEKGKENERVSKILKYITSMKTEDITICIESC
jgi:hypothetical protein